MYFKNPGGRIVAIDDPIQIEKYRKIPGFVALDHDDQVKHMNERIELVKRAKQAEAEALAGITPEDKAGVYFFTVSQHYQADGYGVASACIMRELSRLGVDVKLSYRDQKVGILFHNPYSIAQMRSDFRVIYTMFESDKIPEDWYPYLEMADLILVPSQWCADTFTRAGYKAEVLPLGYDDLSYSFVDRENKRENNKTFNFLHYNAFNIRKGFPEVFKAFVEEFQPDEPVRLILKTTQTQFQIPAPLRGLEQQYPNIKVISGRIPSTEMQDLMADSDCFVFPSRGEGFGMTPLEVMATGMPAIIPNAHGMTEYFDPECMYEVEVDSMCPALYSRYKGVDVGKMVVCSIEDLKRQMRYVYEHQAEALAKGEAASEHVQKWTLRNTAKRLKEIILDLQSRPSPERKLKDVLTLEKV